jgi:DNA-binding response OmpR family regulator
MPVALLCTHAALDEELGHTLLWRGDVERVVAAKPEEARMMAVAVKPDLVLVDRDLPWCERFVTGLREDPASRGLSIAILARGDMDPAEVGLLEAGANAILRLPPGDDWDQRLHDLLHVPARRDTRFAVRFDVESLGGASETSVHGTAVNLSVRGLLLESPVALRLGDDLSLSLLLPGEWGEAAGAGRVVREAGPGRYGIALGALEAPARDRIEAFVQSLAGDSAPSGL